MAYTFLGLMACFLFVAKSQSKAGQPASRRMQGIYCRLANDIIVVWHQTRMFAEKDAGSSSGANGVR
jgi:hypothetical protein